MKSPLLFLVAIGFAATACSGLPNPAPIAPNAPGAAPATIVATNAAVAVIAHRGGAGLAPENTLGSFRSGIALNADFLEMDAQLTQDGIPVIIHDDTIDRTTDGKGLVANFPLDKLQLFNAAAKYANGTTERQVIPTFGQVLELAKRSHARIEVEIKVPAQGRQKGIEQLMLDTIEEYEMRDRVQISSFDFEVLRDLKKLSTRTRTVALVTFDYFRVNDISQPAKIAEQMKGIGVEVFAPVKDLTTPQLVQEMHQRKILVEVWTVDTEAEMKKFIAMGVDGIITNRPDILNRVLGR